MRVEWLDDPDLGVLENYRSVDDSWNSGKDCNLVYDSVTGRVYTLGRQDGYSAVEIATDTLEEFEPEEL